MYFADYRFRCRTKSKKPSAARIAVWSATTAEGGGHGRSLAQEGVIRHKAAFSLVSKEPQKQTPAPEEMAADRMSPEAAGGATAGTDRAADTDGAAGGEGEAADTDRHGHARTDTDKHGLTRTDTHGQTRTGAVLGTLEEVAAGEAASGDGVVAAGAGAATAGAGVVRGAAAAKTVVATVSEPRAGAPYFPQVPQLPLAKSLSARMSRTSVVQQTAQPANAPVPPPELPPLPAPPKTSAVLEDVSFAAAPELAGAGKLARGHLPLLWLLVPIAAAYTFCFTTDFHSTVVGALLLAAGGGGAVVLAWLRPTRTGLWAVCQCTGAAGVGLLVFTANVAPLVDWEGLPPREAELTLRWRQVFIGKPDAKTVSGIARVVAAPELLPELVGTDIYCQVRKPAPELLTERGTVFTATGVLDTTRRALEQPVFVRKVVNGASDAPALAPSADFDAEGFLRYLENRRATMSLARARLGEVVSPPPRFLLLASRQGKRLESGLRRGLESGSATSEFVAGILPQSWRGAWEARWAETSDLFAGILLGRRVARDTRQIFARTGVTHLFSVSGLHVGVIAAMLFWAGRRLRAPAAAWPAVVIVATFLFVMLTGCSPAAFRAWFMVSCVLAARFASRRGSAGAGLIFAATVVLLWEPLLWLDIGFQLSYGVVGALVFYGSPLTGWVLARWTPFAYVPPKSRSVWQRFLLWLQKWFVASFAVSASATLTSAPLIVAHFGLFSAGSLLANLVIVPLAFPVIALGFLSLALGVFGAGALAVPLNALAGVNLVVLGAIAHFVSALPGVAWEFSYRAAWLGSAAALALAAMFLLLPFGAARRGSGWLFWVPPAFVLLTFLAAK